MLTIPRTILLPLLVRGASCARATTHSATDHLLLSASAATLAASSTDTTRGISAEVTIPESTPWSALIRAEKLIEVVKHFAEGDVKIAVDGQHHVTLTSGSRRAKLYGRPPGEFTGLLGAPERAPRLTMPAVDLLKLIERTHYAICPDDSRGAAASALLEWDGAAVRMTALDGTAIASAEYPAPSDTSARTLLSRETCKSLRRSLVGFDGDVTVVAGERSVHVNAPGFSFYSLLAGDPGQYPNYPVLFPQDASSVRISRKAFTDALEAVLVLARKQGDDGKAWEPDAVVEVESGRMRVSSSDPRAGESGDEVEAVYGGESIKTRFRARFMLNLLSGAGGDTVELGVAKDLPVTVTASGFRGLVMSMRV